MSNPPGKLFRPPLLLLALLFLSLSAGAQQWARTRLDASPRHHEYVSVKHGGRTLQAFVVYPEAKGKVPVVLLIHEIFGLTDWAREMADEIAAAGYIVIAPDLLSGAGPSGGGSDAFPTQDAAVKAVSQLDPAQVTADLDASADLAKTIPSANGKLAVVGFCWGGGQSFLFATHRPNLSAAFVFYGPTPPDAALAGITAPVYAFYGGNDARITSMVPATTTAMRAARKTYEPVIYDGAGHGFMRAGEDPGNTNPANTTARDQGFARLKTLLASL
jgi:carboxymethylenebutenolidase